MQTHSDRSNTLYVKTLDDKLIVACSMTIQQALQLKFYLPYDTTKLKIQYGAIEKTIDIVNNSVAFDLITPVHAQYR